MQRFLDEFFEDWVHVRICLALTVLPRTVLGKGWLSAALVTGLVSERAPVNILRCPGSLMPWAVTDAPLKTIMDQADGRNMRHRSRRTGKNI